MTITVPTAYLFGSTAHVVTASASTERVQSTSIFGLVGEQHEEVRFRVHDSVACSRTGDSAPYRSVPSRAMSIEAVPGTRVDQGVDLGLAVALEAATADNELPIPEGWLFVAELNLQGSLRPVRGMLAIAEAALAAGYTTIVCSVRNAREAALVPELCVLGVTMLRDVFAVLRDVELVSMYACRTEHPPELDPFNIDFADVSGHEDVKNALAVAALTGCDVCLLGPAGAGKTSLSMRIQSLFEPMTREQYLEVTRNFSAAGLLDGALPSGRRPFRAPHHTISDVGVIGGGAGSPRPGELPLAHNGILMMDEVTEFRRNVFDLLHSALAAGEVVFCTHRDGEPVEHRFQVKPAMVVYSEKRPVTSDSALWADNMRNRVRPRPERPILFIDVPAVSYADLPNQPRTSSVALRNRMDFAREIMTATREWGRMTWAENTTAPRRIGHTLKHGACSNRDDYRRPWVRVSEALAAVSGSHRVEQSHINQARAWLDGGLGFELVYDALEPEQPIGADAFPVEP